jgi:Fe-S cluster assembly iron-binding protein IscA
MLSISNNVTHKLQEIMAQRLQNAGIGFRVTLNPNDSDNTIFNIKLDNARPDDSVIRSRGIILFMDTAISAQLRDCELDCMDTPTLSFFLKLPDP